MVGDDGCMDVGIGTEALFIVVVTDGIGHKKTISPLMAEKM